jgi:serine/threonine-protein kinase
MGTHKIIAPQTEPPPPGDTRTGTGPALPDVLLSEQVQRLAVCALVGAGLWTYGLVMDSLVRPLTLGIAVPHTNVVIELIAIALSALMLLYVRLTSHSPQLKTDVGLLYFVVNAAAVALLSSLNRMPTPEVGTWLSWNTVVILICGMILPTTPGKILAASVVAASMDPLAVWFAHLRGVEVPSVVATFTFFMPNYACAVVATLPSRVLRRLAWRLRHAQDMGSYHLVELLGSGGMGEVWRARHRLLARDAAIKLVRPSLLGASSEAEAHNMLRRFQREAEATAALSSPHTIQLFDFGVTVDHTFYYVMELLSGRDLESLVRDFGPVGIDRALFLLRQVCHSLSEAHSQGLVHRDVTPANIYVCRMGLDYDFVKVLDFGLVTSSNRRLTGRTLTTESRATTGTPAFMAPEVILEGDVDARADIYALGCVAYYLLTGRLVFEGETPMKLFVQHLGTPPPPPSQRSEIPFPAEIDSLVLACLEKDPARRPQSVDAVVEMMNRLWPRINWDNAAAKVWWDRHLVDLTRPRSLTETPEQKSAPVF